MVKQKTWLHKLEYCIVQFNHKFQMILFLILIRYAKLNMVWLDQII